MKFPSMSCMLALGFWSAAAFLPAAEPAVVEVGGRSLQIPAPEGFERADRVLPRYDEICEAMLPSTNRRLATFARPDFVAKLRAGEIEDADRHFALQSTKQLEMKEISERSFRGARAELKRELEGLRAKLDEETQRLIAAGKATVAKQQGVELDLSVSDTAMLGIFEETDTALGFTLAMNVETPQGRERQVCAAVVAPVNGRMVNFYAYSNYADEADRHWVETAARAWKDAALAVNPRVPGSMLEGFDLDSVGRSALIGGVVGLVIGLGQWLRKRRGQKAA